MFLREPELKAQIIVCCGDMGDKASPEGQQYAWQEINRLREPLGAHLVVATAGNHDMDSRMVFTKYDARGQLQALDPPFPIADNEKWMEYWAKNYAIIDFDGTRVVLLNSAAYHGYQDPKGPPEYLQGRISDRSLDRLGAELTGLGRRPANILICHHHPLRNDEIKSEDYSEMRNGDRLLNQLVHANVGPWLVIHGHKHLPRVIHAPGGNTAPTIFSAGSFSAKLYPEYGNRARNEFYLLELEVPEAVGATSSLKGTIRTWEWTYGNGWQKSRVGYGLGPRAAFGARIDVAEEAAAVATQLRQTSSGTTVPWEEVCQLLPKLKYLIPGDLNGFLDHLRSDHSFRLLHNEQGEICEVQVPTND